MAGRLARLGIAQRLIVEDSSQDPGLPDTDVRTVTGYDDAESLTAARADVETLFLIPVRERPDRVRQHESAVDAALAAGVNRIVDSSFLAAAPDAAFTLARDHYATEESIRARGIPFTFVRGSAYLQVIHWLIGPEGGDPRASRRWPSGAGGARRHGRHCRGDPDLPAAHDGQTYDVTGSQAVSLREVAAEFTRASGRQVTYVEETPEQPRASRRTYGALDWQVEAWVSTYLQIANGELDVVSDTVPRLTGHPARSLPGYLARHPEDYERLLRS